MRPTLLFELGPSILFIVHQIIPRILLLFSSFLGKWKGICNWGKGGLIKWEEILCSHVYSCNGTPTPSFMGQKA